MNTRIKDRVRNDPAFFFRFYVNEKINYNKSLDVIVFFFNAKVVINAFIDRYHDIIYSIL